MAFIALHKVAIDLGNRRFGRLIALGPVSVKKFASGANHVQWLCRCDCGNEKIISGPKLSNGNTKSCGCFQREVRFGNQSGVTHGKHKTPEYLVWHSMLGRCRLPSAKNFKDYGGRGITVCDRWQKFENFFADMGIRPSPKHSLDRRDNDGNYEPSNCRWATRIEQARNRRTNRVVTVLGKTAALADFFKNGSLSRDYERALARIYHGWSPERAISVPRYGK